MWRAYSTTEASFLQDSSSENVTERAPVSGPQIKKTHTHIHTKQWKWKLSRITDCSLLTEWKNYIKIQKQTQLERDSLLHNRSLGEASNPTKKKRSTGNFSPLVERKNWPKSQTFRFTLRGPKPSRRYCTSSHYGNRVVTSVGRVSQIPPGIRVRTPEGISLSDTLPENRITCFHLCENRMVITS
jgi:hypothetical protein